MSCPRCYTANPIRAQYCLGCGYGPLPPAPPKRPDRALQIALAIAAVFVAGCAGLFAVGRQTARTEEFLALHQSDIKGTSPSSGRQLITCQLCNGSGRAPHFSNPSGEPIRSMADAAQKLQADGTVPCPACDATGITVAPQDITIQVVPDSEPTGRRFR